MTEKFVTLPRDVVELALNAFVKLQADDDVGLASWDFAEAGNACFALRAALEQQQGEQEPVGKLIADPYEGHIFIPYGDSWPFNEDLYTRPQPKREPLTDEEIDKLCPQFDDPMRREMWIIGFKAAYNIK